MARFLSQAISTDLREWISSIISPWGLYCSMACTKLVTSKGGISSFPKQVAKYRSATNWVLDFQEWSRSSASIGGTSTSQRSNPAPMRWNPCHAKYPNTGKLSRMKAVCQRLLFLNWSPVEFLKPTRKLDRKHHLYLADIWNFCRLQSAGILTQRRSFLSLQLRDSGRFELLFPHYFQRLLPVETDTPVDCITGSLGYKF
jgi:hypothetical protein